jgi:hypothetical protein
MLTQRPAATPTLTAPRVAPVAPYASASRPATFSLLKSGDMGGAVRRGAGRKAWDNAFAHTNVIAAGRSLNPENRSSG